jgi:hypothetical protein
MSRISFDNGITFKQASELSKREVDLAWSLRNQLHGEALDELNRTTASEQCRYVGMKIYWPFYKIVFEECKHDLIFDALSDFRLSIVCKGQNGKYRIGCDAYETTVSICIKGD